MEKINEGEVREMPGILLPPGTPVMIDSELHPVEFRPVALYLLPDGAIGDKPSVVIAAKNPRLTPTVLIQFSLATLQAALADCGYTITKNGEAGD